MKSTEKDLRLYLESLGLSLEDWGKDGAKTILHLVKEIEKGECQINGVFRTTHTVISDVFCGKEKLYEICQVFSDGRIRERDLPWGSVGEKLFVHEKPLFGLTRALHEELGIDYDSSIRIKCLGEFSLLKASSSYPGLITKNIQTRFWIKIPEKFYREDYIEWQRDKSTYFRWTPRVTE